MENERLRYNPAPYRHRETPRTLLMRASAVAQPNIALVKYWGKQNVEENLPAVAETFY